LAQYERIEAAFDLLVVVKGNLIEIRIAAPSTLSSSWDSASSDLEITVEVLVEAITSG
jgi:hypothetical protein